MNNQRLISFSTYSCCFLLATFWVSADAQEAALETTGADIISTESSRVDAPEAMQLPWSSDAPQLTAEQQNQLNTPFNLPGPPLWESGQMSSGVDIPPPRTASSARQDFGPMVPGTATLFRKVDFKSIIPAGFTSNVMESSAAIAGKYAFFTGNWFAARSVNGGASWSYVNPFSDMSDLCCDQVTLYDEARNMFIWYRQGVKNGSTATSSNRIRVGISTNGGASFCFYDIRPTNVSSTWTGQWFDYPHLQKGANFLYIASNMFNATNDQWSRTVMLRWPLDSLRTCSGFSYNYYPVSDWFTFVPVQGAEHTMYFASNTPSTTPQNSRLAIWKWPENSTSVSVTVKTVAAWNLTSKGQALCGSTTGNWAARTDQRLLTGARYMINGSNLAYPGRKVLGWWWNVKQGGSFAQPYIDGAAFFEDNLAQVSGAQGRPYVWSASTCFLYPSAASNKRGDLGLVINYGSGTNLTPSVAFAIADDYANAPPGFSLSGVKTSGARPSDNKWGDYNTIRPFYPAQDTWIAGAHYIAGTGNCSNCADPVYFAFGRERDQQSWVYWDTK